LVIKRMSQFMYIQSWRRITWLKNFTVRSQSKENAETTLSVVRYDVLPPLRVIRDVKLSLIDGYHYFGRPASLICRVEVQVSRRTFFRKFAIECTELRCVIWQKTVILAVISFSKRLLVTFVLFE
jgi:hypothetical protein